MLREALALYEASGYRVIDRPQEGERVDYLLEKDLPTRSRAVVSGYRPA